MNRLLRNAHSLVQNPSMLKAYIQWSLHWLGVMPTIKISDSAITGFYTFSEFWGTKTNFPLPREISFIEKSLSLTSTIFDIGANIGIFTLLFARLAKQGKVFAFEPVPATFARLTHNISTNHMSNVQCSQMALGGFTGVTDFIVNPKSFATNRLGSFILRNEEQVNKVNITTLDDFCEQNKVETIDFLKIDVEGAEVQVLRGAQQMLREHRIGVIFIEMCPANLLQMNSCASDLFLSVEGFNYGIYSITANGELGNRRASHEFSPNHFENVAIVPIL